MWRSLYVLACLALLLAACAVEPPPAPTRVPTLTPPADAAGAKVVYVHLLASADTAGKVSVGRSAHVVLLSWPVIYRVDSRSSSMGPWSPSGVSQMQVCVSFDRPCTLSGSWVPFTPSPSATYAGSAELGIDEPVDWVGPRTLWMAAQFRDVAGKIVQAVADAGQQPGDVAQVSAQIVGVWDAQTPVSALPPSAQTSIAATQVSHPVSGSVIIEWGRCCIGAVR